MIITALARHAGQSLRFFLDTLEGDMKELREVQRLSFISRAKINGNDLLSSHNIKTFLRMGRGSYRFEFDRPYKNSDYSISFGSNGLDVLITDYSTKFLEIQCLKDIELSLICIGEADNADK